MPLVLTVAYLKFAFLQHCLSVFLLLYLNLLIRSGEIFTGGLGLGAPQRGGVAGRASEDHKLISSMQRAEHSNLLLGWGGGQNGAAPPPALPIFAALSVCFSINLINLIRSHPLFGVTQGQEQIVIVPAIL